MHPLVYKEGNTLTNTAADSLLQYLTDDEHRGRTDEIFTGWARRYQEPVSISDYMEAKEMIRMYKSSRVSCEMMKSCFTSLRKEGIQA